ncbi:MAG TPA: DUF4019 domain-containing protein [Terriglobia bacterium]|nr:DUF4019 domain-containing protein [Terriglobia bacterium]
MNRWTRLAVGAAVLPVLLAGTGMTHGAQNADAQRAAPQKAAAQKAGEQWLALVDAGKYPESWDAASQAFKDAVTKKDWVDSVKGARDPAGEVTSRRLTKADLMKNPPNAPPGDYVGMTYQSSFAKLGAAAETVVMLLDKDGKWRLDGYYVQKAQ